MSETKHYLFLTNYFPPEIGAASHLYHMLGMRLVETGHKVTVVTGFPRYNVQEKDSHYKGKLVVHDEVDGINVIRVAVPEFPRAKPVLRGIEEFLIAGIYLGTATFVAPKTDASFTYSPPLPIALSAYLLSILRGTKAVINIQDLFPKEAIDVGVLKNKFLIKVLSGLESFIYKNADHVVVHSEGNKDYVISRGGKEEKVTALNNWIDLEEIHPGPKQNDFRKKYAPNAGFLVTYAGTMGWNQDVTTLVKLANELKNEPGVEMLFVGDGNNKAEGMKLLEELGIKNARFMPTVPFEEYKDLVRASDVGIVILNPKLLSPVVPSKLLNHMGSAVPVVSCMPTHGDAPKIIKEANCGFVYEPGDYQGLAEGIRKMLKDRTLAQKLGENGRKYAENYFDVKRNSEILEGIFQNIIGK